jgi:hypothetical protein
MALTEMAMGKLAKACDCVAVPSAWTSATFPMHPRAPLTGFDYFELLEDALSYAWTWQGGTLPSDGELPHSS